MTEKQVYYGTVVWFSGKKGFGFVKPDDGEQDFFAHWTNIVEKSGKFKTLVAGQKVSFTVGQNKNGPQAENIVVLEEAAEE